MTLCRRTDIMTSYYQTFLWRIWKPKKRFSCYRDGQLDPRNGWLYAKVELTQCKYVEYIWNLSLHVREVGLGCAITVSHLNGGASLKSENCFYLGQNLDSVFYLNLYLFLSYQQSQALYMFLGVKFVYDSLFVPM